MAQGAELAESISTSAPNRSAAAWLFAGLLLCYLAVWKGDGGYRDLREYLDDAERIWLKGDLAYPPAPGEAPTAPKRYNRFSLGLPFLSGPFVYAGALLERVSGGAIGTRAVAALAAPVFAALAATLLYAIGRQAGCSAIASLWAAIIFGLGSPLLSYSRLFYAEAGMAICLLFALWAHLRAKGTALGWIFLSGAGLAGAFACHYPSALLVAGVWLGMAAANFAGASRLARMGALASAPCVAVAAVAWLNYAHFGGPFRTGYHQTHASQLKIIFSWDYIGKNLSFLLLGWLRVPWTAPVVALWLFSPASAHDSGGLHRRAFKFGALAGLLAQLVFWMVFIWFGMFWLRYLMPLISIVAVGLPLLAETLDRRWPRRGLAYAAMVLLAWNLLGFLHGDDGSPTIYTAPDGSLQTYVWYMQPFEAGKAEGFGTPAGAMQAAVFAVLAAAGVAALCMALRKARIANRLLP